MKRGQYYPAGIDQIERQRKTNPVWSCPSCLLRLSPAASRELRAAANHPPVLRIAGGTTLPSQASLVRGHFPSALLPGTLSGSCTAGLFGSLK